MEWLQTDTLASLIARQYSDELKEPFFVAVGDFGQWDICSNSKTYKVEIKVDVSAGESGNLCIEYWNNSLNKPSGILGTEANYWLHVVPEAKTLKCYEFKIEELHKAVIEHGRVTSGGDFGNSCLCLIPVSKASQYASRQFTIELDEKAAALVC